MNDLAKQLLESPFDHNEFGGGHSDSSIESYLLTKSPQLDEISRILFEIGKDVYDECVEPSPSGEEDIGLRNHIIDKMLEVLREQLETGA